MTGLTGKLLLAAALLFGALGTAEAGAKFMPTSDRTTQPVGHYDLCQRLPQECNERTPKGAPIELSRPLLAEIIQVNN